MEKIWLVKHEGLIEDGLTYFDVVPCKDFESAKKVFDKKVDYILNKNRHFGGFTHEQREEKGFECHDEGDGRFLILDKNEDFYEDVWMVEKTIVAG